MTSTKHKLIAAGMALSVLLPGGAVFAKDNHKDNHFEIEDFMKLSGGFSAKFENAIRLGLFPIPRVKASAGLSEIRGTLTAINGNTLTISRSVNNQTTIYTVDATNAKLMRRFGAKMLLTEMQVNDQIFAEGSLTGTNMVATKIRDFSVQGKNGAFLGTVQTVGTNGSFTLLSRKRGTQTVNVNAQTVIKKTDGTNGQFSDITPGTILIAAGIWDRTNANITANKILLITNK